MSVVWTEEDDKKLEAMKYLEEQGRYGRLVSQNSKNVEMKFDVTDPLKASVFLGDLLYNTELESITGIKVHVIGFPNKSAVDEIKQHLSVINELLNLIS